MMRGNAAPARDHGRQLNAMLTKFFDYFITIEGQRSEYRLQPAWLGPQH
jgi:hypothetical protein